MDSLTHIVLGASIGEVLAGKRIGKKALVIGAIANSFPDIDFLASFWLPLTRDLLAHRGFTHSFLFVFLSAPLLGYLCFRLFRKNDMSWQRWSAFWLLQLFVHIFIDAFNTYGTAWFEPFSHYRVSFNSMFVADPLFSIWPAIAAIALAVISVASKRRLTIATTAIVLSSVYLAVGIFNKTSIDSIAKKQLHNKGVSTEQYFSTPTPLNNLLWYIVTKTDSGFQIGYRSVLDSGRNINFRYTPQNAHLLQQSAYPDDVKRLIRFSQGFYTASMWHDTLVLNNLRFGEINGWADTMPQCVFYYFTDIPDGNDLVVQRGRFAKWNAATFSTFLARISGH